MATYYGGAVNGMQLVMDVTHTQNVAANTTTVTMGVSLIAPQWVSSADVNFAAAISGVYVSTWTGTRTFNAGTTYLGGGSRTVTHNSDGTIPAFNVSAVLGIPFGIPTSLSVGTNYQPPAIARATVANWSGDFVAGVAKTINLPRASTNFVHRINRQWGGSDINIAWDVGTSYTWTPPMSDLNLMPASTRALGTLRTETRNGGVFVGITYKNYYLTAPASVVPTVDTVTWEDTNTTVKTNIGAFVQGLSQVKGTVTASGVYSSWITKKQLRIGGTQLSEGTVFAIEAAGTVTASGEATDSRGRVGTKSANFTVLPYKPPELGVNGFQVRRADSSNVATDQGTYLRIDLHAAASSLKPSTVEKNALKIAVFTRPQSGGVWVARNVINAGLTHNGAIQVSGGSAFPITSAYDVKIELTDNTDAAPTVLQTVVPTATVTLDWNGTNLGIGGYHTRGRAEIHGDLYASNIHSDGALTAQSLTLADDTEWAQASSSLTSNAPQLKNGWGNRISTLWDGVWIKKQGGIVYMYGALTKATAYVSMEVLFTLPPGFRPSFGLPVQSTYFDVGVHVTVRPSGDVVTVRGGTAAQAALQVIGGSFPV